MRPLELALVKSGLNAVIALYGPITAAFQRSIESLRRMDQPNLSRIPVNNASSMPESDKIMKGLPVGNRESVLGALERQAVEQFVRR